VRLRKRSDALFLKDPAKQTRLCVRAVAERGAGGPPAKSPFDDLARQIGEAACRVTDAQVKAVLKATKGEKAAFEIIAAAAMGAGLFRWQQALRAMG
jgi:hypothetical protein